MAKLFSSLNVRALFQGETPLYWAAVAFGVGVGLYFALPVEPPLTFTILLAVAAGFSLNFTKKGTAGRIVAAGLALMIGGGLVAQARTLSVAAPVVAFETRPLRLTGTIEVVDHRPEGGERVVLTDLNLGRFWRGPTPEKIRITIRTEHDQFRPGDRIKLLVILMPPPEPVLPYGYDFARAAWFQRLGAVGFAISPVEHLQVAGEGGWTTTINRTRDGIEGRIRAVLPGESGAVAVALLTGLRGGLPKDVVASMRDAGLAHLLAISGLHMALVTGIIFFALRALLALSPRLALNWPIKKIAALGAWGAALGYLALSGAGISTQRAFVMVSVALFAVLVDRQAISMRTVAIAALVVLVLTPEAILGASFQMSFAAVVGLIAGFEYYREKFMRRGKIARTAPRRALRYLSMTLIATLIAQAAIAPFEIYHFHRIPLIGAAANLVAMPVMSFIVMPAGVLALALMPMGLEAPALHVMGWGIDVIIASARDVGGVPGANLTVSRWPHSAFLMLVAAGLLLTLARNGLLKKAALAPLVFAVALIVKTMPPDILIARDGTVFAVRGEGAMGAMGAKGDGDARYYVSTRRAGRFARQVWQETFALDEDIQHWDRLEEQAGEARALACDSSGCLYRRGGIAGEASAPLVAFVFSRGAFPEDCLSADLVITTLRAPKYCRSTARVLDAASLETDGAATIHMGWKDGNPAFDITSAGSERGQRPWVGGGRD